MSGKLIRIPADGGEPTLHLWHGSKYPPLDMLQDLVKSVPEGYTTIERVRVRETGRLRDAWCNENGLALRLPRNMVAFAKYGVDIVGPLVVWIPDPKVKHPANPLSPSASA